MMVEDGQQLLAASSTEPNLLVVAPPGCGKTELLALRAQALIPRLQPNQRILALTFTNRAKVNLGERLRRLLGTSRFQRYLSVRNFHGHATEIVLAHGPTIGIRCDTLLLPGSKTLRRALKAFSSDTHANRAAEDLLSQVKREPLDDAEVLAELERAGDALARRIELERATANQLHYDDLLRHAQRLLRIDEIANLYHQHYGAVLVDEFQDLSMQQLDLVMRSCVRSRTFVGDPLQGIYSWAGAAPQKIEANLRSCCGDPIQLTVSYRSSPAVLAMLNGVSERMGAPPLRAFAPNEWPGGGAAAALAFPSRVHEAEAIALLSQQITEAEPTASVGVIARSSWRRKEIDEAIASRSSILCRRWDLAIEDPAILERLRSAVRVMPRNVSFDDARDRIVTRIDPSDVDTIEQVEDAFEQLAQGSAPTVAGALAQLRVRGDHGPVGPGVHLLNAHIGKGQQFDWVCVPGVEEWHLPDNRSTLGEKLAEEERVLLVMLSRARHGIVVTRADTSRDRYGRIHSTTKSRWWNGLAASATMDAQALTAHLVLQP